jgi:Domain of unknown function (DUF4252)
VTYNKHLDEQRPKAMKTIFAGVILSLLLITACYSQSDSFLTLKERFAYDQDVYSFSTSTFLGGALIKLAGEHEFYDAVKRVKRISVITIPRESFRREEVSLSGFKKVMRKDSFQELARMKEDGDVITFYMKSTESTNNRYMILVEDSDNVVAIEWTGYIDPEFLLKCESQSFKEKS